MAKYSSCSANRLAYLVIPAQIIALPLCFLTTHPTASFVLPDTLYGLGCQEIWTLNMILNIFLNEIWHASRRTSHESVLHSQDIFVSWTSFLCVSGSSDNGIWYVRRGIIGPFLCCRNDTFDDFLMTVRESAYRNACIGVFSVNTDVSWIASFLLIEDEYVSHCVTIRRNTHLAAAQVSSDSY